MGVDVSIVRSGGILYLTYIDPVNLREYPLARGIEYVPFYGLLAWTAVSALLMRWGKGDAGG